MRLWNIASTNLGFRIMLTAAACLCYGCSGSSSHGLPIASIDTAEFQLNVWEDSLVDEASAAKFSLAIRENSSGAEVGVVAEQCAGLKALYFDLAYDPQQSHPVEVVPSGLLGPPESLLSVDSFAEPGKVYSGQVLTAFQDKPGFTGSGELVTIRFEPGPVDAPRQVCDAPTSVLSRPLLTIDSTGVLSWLYCNQGDYNLDGMVTVNDLTPLGQHFNASGPFDPTSALYCVDGNRDGMITVNDITPIGMNFGRTVREYNLYMSDSESDYPQSHSDSNGSAELLTSIAFSDAEGEAADCPCFSYVLDTPIVNNYYWIRAADGLHEGVSSPFVRWAEVNRIELDPAIELQGDGSAEDPYLLETTFVLQFFAYSSLGEDWTNSVEWLEDSDVKGTGFSETTAGMQIVSPFDYEFKVWAEHSTGSSNELFFHVVAPT